MADERIKMTYCMTLDCCEYPELEAIFDEGETFTEIIS